MIIDFVGLSFASVVVVAALRGWRCSMIVICWHNSVNIIVSAGLTLCIRRSARLTETHLACDMIKFLWAISRSLAELLSTVLIFYCYIVRWLQVATYWSKICNLLERISFDRRTQISEIVIVVLIAPPPLKFWLNFGLLENCDKNVVPLWKFSFKSVKFWAKKVFGESWGIIEILRTHNLLCWKFAAVCRKKIATSCNAYFFDPPRRWLFGLALSVFFSAAHFADLHQMLDFHYYFTLSGLTDPRFRGIATGGISVYIPPNQSTLNFLCGCFVSLTHLYPPKSNSWLRLRHTLRYKRIS